MKHNNVGSTGTKWTSLQSPRKRGLERSQKTDHFVLEAGRKKDIQSSEHIEWRFTARIDSVEACAWMAIDSDSALLRGKAFKDKTGTDL